MAWITPKTNWQGGQDGDKPTATDFNRIEGNIVVVREQANLPLKYEVVSSFPAHAVGRVVFHTGNGRAYVSDGTNWIDISGAIGDAIAANVLAGKVFSSQVAGPGVTGTMPNRGAHNITPGTSDITIPNGYHSGAGKVASLGGNAAAGNVLTGKTFSSDVSGRAAAGTMPNRGAVVLPSSEFDQLIAAGYHNGLGYAAGTGRKYLYREGEKDVAWVSSAIAGSVYFSDYSACLRVYMNDNNQNKDGAWVTDAPIDLTPYARAYIAWDNDGDVHSSYNYSYFIASPNKLGAYNDYAVRKAVANRFRHPSDSRVDYIDVSGLSGEHYLRVHARSPSNIESYVNMKACWLTV